MEDAGVDGFELDFLGAVGSVVTAATSKKLTVSLLLLLLLCCDREEEWVVDCFRGELGPGEGTAY
jgi:hypothetical protein